MMIYVTLVALLDGIRKLLEAKGRHSFELIGAGSSFALIFSKNPKTRSVRVRSDRGEIGSSTCSDIKAAVWDAAVRFVQANPLDEADAVHDDLATALQKFSGKP